MAAYSVGRIGPGQRCCWPLNADPLTIAPPSDCASRTGFANRPSPNSDRLRAALLTLGIYLANGGGITTKVSQNLGLRDGIVRIYNENTSTNKVYASIAGYWTSDRTPADGKYLIIGNEGKEFVVTDGQGVYKTGAQIITSKVTTEVGEAARTEIRNISFNDEDAIAPLQELQNAYPGADIYLTGELAVDFPEDLKIPIESNQMVTVALSGCDPFQYNYK